MPAFYSLFTLSELLTSAFVSLLCQLTIPMKKMCSEKDVGQTLTAMIKTQKQDCAANYLVMHVSKPVMDSSHFW